MGLEQSRYIPSPDLVGEWVIGNPKHLTFVRDALDRETSPRERKVVLPVVPKAMGTSGAILQIYPDGWFRYIKVKGYETIRAYSGYVYESGIQLVAYPHAPKQPIPFVVSTRSGASGISLRSNDGKRFRKTSTYPDLDSKQ